MGTVTIPADGSIYLDANCIIYFVERIDPYHRLLAPVWDAATRGTTTIVTSELTILEVLVRPLRDRVTLVEQAFRDVLFNSRELQLVPVTRSTLEGAARLRASHGLKTVDAIHAATALEISAKLIITNDEQFRRVSGLPTTLLSGLA